MLGDKPQTTLWWKYVQHNPRKPPAKQYKKVVFLVTSGILVTNVFYKFFGHKMHRNKVTTSNFCLDQEKHKINWHFWFFRWIRNATTINAGNIREH